MLIFKNFFLNNYPPGFLGKIGLPQGGVIIKEFQVLTIQITWRWYIYNLCLSIWSFQVDNQEKKWWKKDMNHVLKSYHGNWRIFMEFWFSFFHSNFIFLFKNCLIRYKQNISAKNERKNFLFKRLFSVQNNFLEKFLLSMSTSNTYWKKQSSQRFICILQKKWKVLLFLRIFLDFGK